MEEYVEKVVNISKRVLVLVLVLVKVCQYQSKQVKKWKHKWKIKMGQHCSISVNKVKLVKKIYPKG